MYPWLTGPQQKVEDTGVIKIALYWMHYLNTRPKTMGLMVTPRGGPGVLK